jgi:hypothetical protein
MIQPRECNSFEGDSRHSTSVERRLAALIWSDLVGFGRILGIILIVILIFWFDLP